MQTDIHTPEPQASTLSGELSLLAPDLSRINLPDIITALGHEVRFCGHTTEPVTVLQHSLCVFMLAYIDGASCADMRHALWHDAPEAYLKDIPRPLKKLLGQPYADLEQRFEAAVGAAIGVDLASPPALLRKWDTEALAAECQLWRPEGSYSDWVNLPDIDAAVREIAVAARRLSRRDVVGLMALDRRLSLGDVVFGLMALDRRLSLGDVDAVATWFSYRRCGLRYGQRKGVAA